MAALNAMGHAARKAVQPVVFSEREIVRAQVILFVLMALAAEWTSDFTRIVLAGMDAGLIFLTLQHRRTNPKNFFHSLGRTCGYIFSPFAWRAFWVIELALCVSFCIAFAGWAAGSWKTEVYRNDIEDLAIGKAGYLVAAVVQQFLLQKFLYPKLRCLVSSIRAAWGTAAIFALLHTPNFPLMLLTFCLGFFGTLVCQSYGSVVCVSCAHALLGASLVLFTPIHLHVGVGYLQHKYKLERQTTCPVILNAPTLHW